MLLSRRSGDFDCNIETKSAALLCVLNISGTRAQRADVVDGDGGDADGGERAQVGLVKVDLSEGSDDVPRKKNILRGDCGHARRGDDGDAIQTIIIRI